MAGHVDQHFVPRFLLAQWQTPPDDKLTAFRWAHHELKSQRYKAKSVAKTRHLYSLNRSSSEPEVGIERDFFAKQIDDPAAIVHAKILDGGIRSLLDADSRVWAPFLVAQMLRVPSVMTWMREQGAGHLRRVLDEDPEDYERLREPGDPGTLSEWFDKHDPDEFEDLAVRTLPATVFSPLLLRAVSKGYWAVRTFKRPRFDLLISDRPLIYDGTLDTKFVLALPLSPAKVFLAFNDDQNGKTLLDLHEAYFIKQLNLRQVQRAESYVYSTSNLQQPFVRKHLRRS